MTKGCYYKPDGSLFVLVGANKMERGANNGTYIFMCVAHLELKTVWQVLNDFIPHNIVLQEAALTKICC